MTRQEVPPLLSLSGTVLEAQWDRVGHITLSDRCRRPVGREKKKKPRCLIFGTRTIGYSVQIMSLILWMWRTVDGMPTPFTSAQHDRSHGTGQPSLRNERWMTEGRLRAMCCHITERGTPACVACTLPPGAEDLQARRESPGQTRRRVLMVQGGFSFQDAGFYSSVRSPVWWPPVLYLVCERTAVARLTLLGE